MQPRVWLFACTALLGACGGHGEFPFGSDGGGGDAAAPRVDARASDAGPTDAGSALPPPVETANGTVSCAEGGRYTVCGAVTEGGATALPTGETVSGQLGGSHTITGSRFGIQGGLHVVR